MYIFQYQGPGHKLDLLGAFLVKLWKRVSYGLELKTSKMMHMTFYCGGHMTLLFDNWKTQPWLGYILTLVVVFLFLYFMSILSICSLISRGFRVVKVPQTSMLLSLEETLENLDLGSWSQPFLVFMQG